MIDVARNILVLVLASVILGGATCAAPQKPSAGGDALERRVANAERLAIQNRKLTDRMEKDLRRDMAAIAAENEALREGMRRLRGQLEQTEADLRSQMQRMGAARSSSSSSTKKAAARPGPKLSVPTAPTGASPDAVGEEALFADGQDRFRRHDYKGSQEAFSTYLDKYASGANAAAALYWLGESHFALREYSKAIIKFDQVTKRHSGSKWVAPALLKTGFAFLELNQPNDAQLFFQQVVKEHPRSEEARLARKELADS